MGKLPAYLKDVKKIGFFGLGTSNSEIAKIIAKQTNAEIILRSDGKVSQSELPHFLKNAKIYDGERSCEGIDEDVLILSPSVKRSRREIIDAKARGVRLTSDAELFFDTCRSDVFAVSGSDGKSTTTELASRLFASGYGAVHKSGNCGVAMTPFALSEESGDAHVVELSSFMLEYFEPRTRRAVITGISENHLDWHGSFDGYIRAKERIYRRTDGAVVWADGEITRGFLRKYPAYAVLSRKYTDEDLRPFGAEIRICVFGGEILINGEPVLKLSDIRRRESHNIENLMSAMALSYGYYGREELLSVAREFSGIGHRAESVGTFLGVEYIDSSIDSTPARTITTLKGLSRRVILLLGGRGKGLSYKPLAPHALRWASTVILTGENRGEIKRALEECETHATSGTKIYEVEDFDEAVRTARDIARKGDTVLLSPASTSYDRFKNFEERSHQFRKIISE